MTERPRLLFLCHTLPYPPDGGVWIRSYNILRLLAQTYEVTLLCFERTLAGAPDTEIAKTSAAEALGGVAQVEVFRVPQLYSRARFVLDHSRSLLSARVFTRYLYESPQFRARLRTLIRSGRFEVVHMDSLDLSGYLPELTSLPVICVHHNVESQLLHRRAQMERSWARRTYIERQASLTEAEERRWCPRVRLNVAVSEQDVATLQRLVPAASFAVVPNGVDTEYFTPLDRKENGLVFVGSNTWFPNRDAHGFFCEQILPQLRESTPDLVVRWVGAATPADQELSRSRFQVDLTGYVADVRPHIAAASCYIVPLRVGGGSRLKILDAWAMGKAVVSTSVGCEGLSAVDGQNILIADSPEAFAGAVLRVLRDGDLRQRLGAAARATVEREYSWEVIGKRMLTLYTDAAAGQSSAVRGRSASGAA